MTSDHCRSAAHHSTTHVSRGPPSHQSAEQVAADGAQVSGAVAVLEHHLHQQEHSADHHKLVLAQPEHVGRPPLRRLRAGDPRRQTSRTWRKTKRRQVMIRSQRRLKMRGTADTTQGGINTEKKLVVDDVRMLTSKVKEI